MVPCIHIVNICVLRGGEALLNKGSLKLLSSYYLAQFSRGGFDSTSGFVYSYSGCSVVRGKGGGPDSGKLHLPCHRFKSSFTNFVGHITVDVVLFLHYPTLL